MFNLLSSKPVYFIDNFEPVAKWLTIALASALILSLFIVWLIKFCLNRFGKKECSFNLLLLAKRLLLAFIIYALLLGIFMLVLEILKKYDSNYLDYNYVNEQIVTHVFLPLLITAIIALSAIITLYLLTKKGKSIKKIATIFAIIIGVSVIVSLVLIYLYYSNNIVNDGYYTDEASKFSPLALYLGAGALIVLTVTTALLVGKKNKTSYTTKTLSLAGVCLALSFTLSYIKFEAAWIQGGSITLVSFLPICIFSYVYGMRKGLIVGLIYGILQAIQDPFIVHPAQFLLDYPIAFSMISFSGLLTDLNLLNNLPPLKFAIGAALTGLFRYIAHTISGVFAFGAYALSEGASNFLVYSLVYNSYVFIDIALVIIVGVILFSSKAFTKELNKINPLYQEFNSVENQ